MIAVLMLACAAPGAVDWSPLLSGDLLTTTDGDLLVLGGYGGPIMLDNGVQIETLAVRWELDIIGADTALLMSWPVDEALGCTDEVYARDDGAELAICGAEYEVTW